MRMGSTIWSELGFGWSCGFDAGDSFISFILTSQGLWGNSFCAWNQRGYTSLLAQLISARHSTETSPKNEAKALSGYSLVFSAIDAVATSSEPQVLRLRCAA